MAEIAVPVARRRTSLALRVASGFVAVPILLGTAYFADHGWAGFAWYGLLISAASLYAAWEVRGMLTASRRRPVDPVLFGVAGALPFDAWFLAPPGAEPALAAPHAALIVLLGVLGGLVLLLVRRQLSGALDDWALSLALALYIGGLLQFYAPLRHHADGAFWVILTLCLSWVCDSSAFFVGRAFGRLRLAPLISPGKSVEGASAGLVGGAVAGALVGLAAGHPPLLLAGFGLAIAVATIVGDLAESLLKRQTGVKDSGVLIPGHGGLLDRMDSLLFCAPVAVLYLRLFA